MLNASAAALDNLADHGVQPGESGQAQIISGGIRFPIAGGDLREGPLGTLEHAGGLVLKRAGRRVKFARPELRIGSRRATVYTTVAGVGVRLFDGDLSRAIVPRGSDNPFRLKRIKLALARDGAAVMTQELGTPFSKGDPVGRLNVKPFVESDQQEEA